MVDMAKVVGTIEIKTARFWRAALCELLGTFALMFIQCTVVLAFSDKEADIYSKATRIGLAMGLVLFTQVETIGHISGCNINPAVSIGLLVAQKISILKCVVYVMCQCLGAIIGAAVVYALTPEDHRETLAANSLGDGVTPVQGVFMELITTYFLVMTILGSTDDVMRGSNIFLPSVAIGMTLGMGIIATMPYSGASLNPARTLGPAVRMNLWKDHWVYWIGPISGGIVAALVYRFGIQCKTSRNNNSATFTTDAALKDELWSAVKEWRAIQARDMAINERNPVQYVYRL